jgi:hypothetical protein
MESIAFDSIIYYLSTESGAHIIEGIEWNNQSTCENIKEAFKDSKASITFYNKTNNGPI